MSRTDSDSDSRYANVNAKASVLTSGSIVSKVSNSSEKVFSNAVRSNYVRASAAATAKEWFHFLIFSDEAHILINFSLMNQNARGLAQQTLRLTILINQGDGWQGEVIELPGPEVVPGELRLGNQQSYFDYRDGYYQVRFQGSQGIINLDLVPAVDGVFANTVSLDHSAHLKWIGVPRLVANGQISWQGRQFTISQAAAYHDHNWGEFLWGRDFGWVWAIIVPDRTQRYAAVYTRLTDCAAHTTLSEALMVWQDGTYLCTFRDDEVQTQIDFVDTMNNPFRIPGVMKLAVAGAHADIPLVNIQATNRIYCADISIRCVSLAQIGVPSDGDILSVSVLNESIGEAEFRLASDTQTAVQASVAFVEQVQVIRSL